MVNDLPLTCQHCPNIEPPFYIVGDEHNEEAWCMRCVLNMELTTPVEARPAVRRITPEWSKR